MWCIHNLRKWRQCKVRWKKAGCVERKEKDRLCLAGDRQRDRWDTRLSLWGLYRATVQGVMWTTGTTGVESCNDTPSNTSDSHFENIITIYHTLNHPLRAWECAWVCVWERHRENDRVDITSIAMHVNLCWECIWLHILQWKKNRSIHEGLWESVAI